MHYLFGQDYTKVEQNWINATPKTVILYIASCERAKEIFNIANLCAAQIYVNNNNKYDKIPHSCCDKVIIVNSDTEREIICYILEETGTC